MDPSARRTSPTRRQKRWAPRLRMAGALLLLAGAVGVLDLCLPRSRDPLGVLPVSAQLAGAALAILVGAALFIVGRRAS